MIKLAASAALAATAIALCAGCATSTPTPDACDAWDRQLTGWAKADVTRPGVMNISTRVWSPQPADQVHRITWHVRVPGYSQHYAASDTLSKTATNVVGTDNVSARQIKHDQNLTLVIDTVDDCQLNKTIKA